MLDQNKKFFTNQQKYKKPIIDKIPFTNEEFEKITLERDALLAERKEVMIRLQTAREMGDLSENGAYKYAKFELGNIGRRLRELNHLIENGYVPTQNNTQEIAFGSKVTLKNDQQQITYQLVSEHESNPRIGKLSLKSPIGVQLMGKKTGDQITITTPRGDVSYAITKIE